MKDIITWWDKDAEGGNYNKDVIAIQKGIDELT